MDNSEKEISYEQYQNAMIVLAAYIDQQTKRIALASIVGKKATFLEEKSKLLSLKKGDLVRITDKKRSLTSVNIGDEFTIKDRRNHAKNRRIDENCIVEVFLARKKGNVQRAAFTIYHYTYQENGVEKIEQEIMGSRDLSFEVINQTTND